MIRPVPAALQGRTAERPVRVALVAPSTDILGGQAVQAARLMANLREAPGVEVDFIPVNPRLPGALGAAQRVKYARTLVTQPAYLASLAARLRRCDVVHAFSASYLSFVLAPTPALLVAKAYGKRVIINYRSGEADDHLRRWRTAAPTLRMADEVVVPSDYLVGVFRRFGVAARAIPNVVELERFRPRPRTPLRPVFLANRNLEPLYNVACVLRAFARIQARYPEASLVVAGDGSQRDALRDQASSGGLRNVRFVGRVAPEQMHRLYDEADVYLNASDIDNAPGSILEAFASGVPVVTTDAGGIPFLVAHGRTGMMVERGDDAALAAAAFRLLEEPALAAEIAARAGDECRARYHWAAVRDQWLGLYRALARSAPHSRAVPVAALGGEAAG
jgi:glycosyltransferase involved in cell wall biosynthesis